MIKIIDEIYMTYEDQTETEWIIRYSVVTKPGEGGYWKSPKLFSENERAICSVGAAHYMFIFEEDGKIGTTIMLLEDHLFDDDELYESTINHHREMILNKRIETDCIKFNGTRPYKFPI